MSWYALHVRSCCEHLVDGALDSMGIERYWPFREHKSQLRGKEHLIRRSIFPGYVFSRFEYEDGRERVPVISIPEVIRVVGFGNQVASIPDHEIESVRIMVATPLAIRVATPIDLLMAGDEVLIKSGPLAGVRGNIVWSASGQPRVIVGISMLGGYRSVEVDRAWLAVEKKAA
jgi:transcriptional antiterminator NusG